MRNNIEARRTIVKLMALSWALLIYMQGHWPKSLTWRLGIPFYAHILGGEKPHVLKVLSGWNLEWKIRSNDGLVQKFGNGCLVTISHVHISPHQASFLSMEPIGCSFSCFSTGADFVLWRVCARNCQKVACSRTPLRMGNQLREPFFPFMSMEQLVQPSSICVS